jgi:hypothetical protein
LLEDVPPPLRDGDPVLPDIEEFWLQGEMLGPAAAVGNAQVIRLV